jgi:hypothetical protein
MKTAEEILKERGVPTCDEDVIDLMHEFANQSKWIAVDEAFPETNSTVLVVANGGSVFIMYYGLSNKGIDDWYHGNSTVRPYMIPTHWQPLPIPPQI